MRVRHSVASLFISAVLSGLSGCSESPAGPVEETPQFSHAGAVGYLQAWGHDPFGQVSGTPTGLFSAVSAGGFHNVAIRSNGRLASWGRDSENQVSGTPAGTFKAVSAGYVSSVGLRTDGTLVSWGYDFYQTVTNTPAGYYTDVAAGLYHGVALAMDGTLVSWGDDSYGQVTNTPAGTFVRVEAGGRWSVAIASDGTIVSWGASDFGQASTPAGTFTAVGAGIHHGVARRSDGTLAAWGENSHGQTVMPGGTYLAVTGGSSFTVAISAGGVLSAWGTNEHGQLNVPSGVYSAVDAGSAHVVAIAVPAYAIPLAPTTITATPVFSPSSPNPTIAVAWTDASTNEAHFQLQRRQRINNVNGPYVTIASPNANVTSGNDGVTQGSYQYRIRACNSLGCSAWKSSVLVDAYSLPAAPSNLVATPFSSTQMSLTWTDGSANETHFLVSRRHKTGGVFGPWTNAASPTANTTSLNYDAVTTATTYQYRIRACNPAGCSAFDISAQVTTP